MDEAIRLIQLKGFAFTISDLASRLAVSKRTIYEHFSSKEEIIEVVIDQFISKIKAKEQQIAADDSLTIVERIREVLVFIPKEFELMDIRLLLELKKHHYQQWCKLDRFMREEWAIVEQLMNEGIQAGVIKDIQLSLFIELYLAMINQIYDPQFKLKHKQSMGELLQSMMDILFYGVVK